jgi:hypothetical protein
VTGQGFVTGVVRLCRKDPLAYVELRGSSTQDLFGLVDEVGEVVHHPVAVSHSGKQDQRLGRRAGLISILAIHGR